MDIQITHFQNAAELMNLEFLDVMIKKITIKKFKKSEFQFL